MHTNIKLRNLADLVVEGAHTGHFDERITAALRTRVARTPGEGCA
jgi:hypothetical protein